MLVPTELISQAAFSSTKAKTLNCMIFDDPATGVRAVPNCTCTYKIPESELVQYRFNSCGYRTNIECGSKPAGTYRIVLVGTSMAEGLHVRREQTFAALLPRELSRETGRKIDLYDAALEWETPHRIDLDFRDVLAARPDMILWTVTKWDVENASLAIPASKIVSQAGPFSGRKLKRTWERVVEALHRKTVAELVEQGPRYVFGALFPGTSFLLQHAIYENRQEFLEHYLVSPEETEFLKATPSAAWQTKLQEFDHYVADVEMQAKLARIPLVVAVLPTRAEATLISVGKWPAALNPYKFGEEVRSVIERYDGTYIDLLHAFSDVSDTDQFYYPVDGHPNAGGHAVFASLLAKGLTRNSKVNFGRAEFVKVVER